MHPGEKLQAGGKIRLTGRDPFFENARFLAILLVVAGHAIGGLQAAVRRQGRMRTTSAAKGSRIFSSGDRYTDANGTRAGSRGHHVECTNWVPPWARISPPGSALSRAISSAVSPLAIRVFGQPSADCRVRENTTFNTQVVLMLRAGAYRRRIENRIRPGNTTLP